MEKLIKDITNMVWNKFLATPKNEHKEMQFSYENLKNEIGAIVIDYLTKEPIICDDLCHSLPERADATLCRKCGRPR